MSADNKPERSPHETLSLIADKLSVERPRNDSPPPVLTAMSTTAAASSPAEGQRLPAAVGLKLPDAGQGAEAAKAAEPVKPADPGTTSEPVETPAPPEALLPAASIPAPLPAAAPAPLAPPQTSSDPPPPPPVPPAPPAPKIDPFIKSQPSPPKPGPLPAPAAAPPAAAAPPPTLGVTPPAEKPASGPVRRSASPVLTTYLPLLLGIIAIGLAVYQAQSFRESAQAMQRTAMRSEQARTCRDVVDAFSQIRPRVAALMPAPDRSNVAGASRVTEANRIEAQAAIARFNGLSAYLGNVQDDVGARARYAELTKVLTVIYDNARNTQMAEIDRLFAPADKLFGQLNEDCARMSRVSSASG